MEANTFLWSLYNMIISTHLTEWVAVVSGIIYVMLASKENIWCWPFAILSSFLYVYLCIEFKLYIESILQTFYLVMGIVGWYVWSQQKAVDHSRNIIDTPSRESSSAIITWDIKRHVLNSVLSGIAAVALGYFFETNTDQANPYIDAFTTVFSLVATFMVVRKVLENWIYWIVIDVVSMYLYYQRGLSLTVVLYFIFTLLAIIGFISWRKRYLGEL